MASRLELLQKRFVDSAFGKVDAAFVRSIEGGGKLTAAEAAGVYRDGYPARLSEALGETFEACWRVLGDEDFLKACKIYARTVPSVSHNLSDYGSSFPVFLQKRFKKDAPFIKDLAVLEWSFKEIFHAVPHSGLTPKSLSAVVKKDSVLIFGNTVRMLNLNHSVHDLWKRNRDDSTPLREADWKNPQHVLLYKGGGTQVFSSVIAAPEASALSSLMSGLPLSQALAASDALDEAAARNLFTFISNAGLVTEVR